MLLKFTQQFLGLAFDEVKFVVRELGFHLF
jgi:hypothetical protein